MTDLVKRLEQEAVILPHEVYVWFNPLLLEVAAEITRLQEAKRRALAVADERSKENVALRAEIGRLRARPTEEEVAKMMWKKEHAFSSTGPNATQWTWEMVDDQVQRYWRDHARAVMALFPKVQP
jgi:hypothetical protein